MPNPKASQLMIISSCGAVVVAAAGLLAYSFWNEARVKNLSNKLRAGELHSDDVQKKLIFLTDGCNKSGRRSPSFPPFVAELVRGNCRSLANIRVSLTYFNEPNFRNLDLRGADFSRSFLVAGQFDQSDLTKANLKSADLSGADLSFVLLKEAGLQQANLSSARIHNSNLQGASFQGANLAGANFIASNLLKVDFSNADLREAVLRGAVAPGANFHKANLDGAVLVNTNLKGAINLTDQQLQGERAPFMCKAWLPDNVQVNPNRDCAKLPSILAQRFPWHFPTEERAAKYLSFKAVAPPSGFYPVPNGSTYYIYAP